MTSRDDPLHPPPGEARRFPAVVYLAGVALVVTALLLEIVQGRCPVP